MSGEANNVLGDTQGMLGRRVAKAMIGTDDMGSYAPFVREFLNQLKQEHRTHQQDVIRALTQILAGYAGVDHDLRNEAAEELCRKLKPVIDENPLPRL